MSPRRIVQFILAISLALASAGMSTFCALAKSVDINSWQHHASAGITILFAIASIVVLLFALFAKAGATGGARKFLHDIQAKPVAAKTSIAFTIASSLLAAAAFSSATGINSDAAVVRMHINDREINRAPIMQLVQSSRSVFGDSGAVNAYTRYAFANLSHRRTLPEAEWAYTEAFQCNTRRGWNHSYDTIYILGKLAETQSEMRKFNSAEQNFLEALKTIDDNKAKLNSDNILRGLRISCLNGLARLYYQQSDYEKAALYERQVVDANNKFGQSFRADIGPVEHLADLYVKLHQYQEAEPLARQAVDYYTSQALSPIGNNSGGSLASSYRRLATILRGKNNPTEAERFELRAEAIDGRRQ
jgi:tetratricopeptide (TPR) repeat protein